jgi:hypothetical protein
MANDLYDTLLRGLVADRDAGLPYTDAKAAAWRHVSEDKDRYLDMFFQNWFNANWSRKQYTRREPPPKGNELAKQRRQDAQRMGIALMNTFLSDGETRLKDATGRQVRAEAGWLSRIAKFVKPNEIVGKKLTAEQIANLKKQGE